MTPAMRSTAAGPAGPGTALRLCFVSETYPPEVNGVALTVARVVDGLRGRGHHVQVVRPRQPVDGQQQRGGDRAHRPGPPVDWRTGRADPPTALARPVDAAAPDHEDRLMPGVPIPRYPHLRMGWPCVGALVRAWRARPPDAVHIATEGPLGWSALQAARRLMLPVTSDFRTNFHAYCGHYGFGALARPMLAYLRHFHNRSHCTMVPTEALRRELAAAGFRGLTVVGRGVDVAQFGPSHRSRALRDAWGVGDDDVVLLFVGRLAPEKNLHLVLQAHQLIRLQRPRTRLVFVGDGPQRLWLQSRCPEAIFAGQRRGADLAAHYASADLFLFPSLSETFGNVVPEAMASGLPVVAFDHAAAGQLVNAGVHGQLAPPDQPQAFLDHAVTQALARDPLEAMGQAARASALRLDWGQVVSDVERVIRDAIAGREPRGEASGSCPRAPACGVDWDVEVDAGR